MSLLLEQFRSLILEIESSFSFQSRRESTTEIGSIRDVAGPFRCAHERAG
jgi:hypothetical protein